MTLREALEQHEAHLTRLRIAGCEHGSLCIRFHGQCVQVRASRECAQYVYRACPDDGFLGELIRALSERLARLVGTGDVGVLP